MTDFERPEQKDVPCAYCDTSVCGAAFVLCATCEVPVHRDCWNESGSCPAYGCGDTRPLDPAEALFRKSTSPTLLVGHAPGQLTADGADRQPQGTLALVGASAAAAFSAAAKSVAAAATAASHALTGPRSPAPPALTPAERAAEIKRLEARLYELQLRRWKRSTVIVAFILLLPLLLRFVARPLVFPWLIALVAYASWPGHRESSRRHERALRARLEQLELHELGG